MRHRRVAVLATALLTVAVAAPVASSAAAAPASSAAAGRSTASGGLGASQVAALRRGTPQRSIIILRDRHRSLLGRAAGEMAARSAAVRADQQPIRAELSQVHASNVHSYSAVDAIAATVTPAEIAHLQQNSAVQAVVPDKVIVGPTPPDQLDASVPAPKTGGAHATAAANANAAISGPICPSDPAKPLVEPEALQLMNAADQVGSSAPVAQQIVDGTGVKVAFIADGLDINNPDFIRGDGSHVFVDYQDFSGEGVNAPTSGDEAFGDASSIAAQGTAVDDLSQFVNAAHPLPAGCTIRVLGVAPGASLIGLKVFGISNAAYSSYFIQAIDYAITDGADVLNESFGSNPYPDTKNDPIALADEAAISAGVTVTVSSGDSGIHNTIESPSAIPGVIGVGATTQYQSFQQEVAEGAQFGSGSWLSNNISSLSSGGETMYGPNTVTVVAPGEAGWAVCTPNQSLYFACGDNNGGPSDIELFSGTSESAPLTAGTAALVIEAYENTHHGVRPTPALVREIIASTATDLHAPADEQGAGLVNALKAVQLAESVHDGNGSPAAVGNGLLANTTGLTGTGGAGTSTTFTVGVTNDGTASQTVAPSLQTLNPTPLATDTGSVTLDDSTDPTFVDQIGATDGFALHTFTIPSGAGRLDARITWDAVDQPNSRARLTLFDPSGDLADYSLPQGNGGFGEATVHDPAPGTWTALIWTRHDGTQINGPVTWSFLSQSFTSAGRIRPASMKLAPGATGQFRVTVPYPAHVGDLDGDLRMNTGGPDDGGIPVTLRAYVPVPPGSGAFSGVLNGGNGRPIFGGDNETFQFKVPAKRPALNVAVNLADTGYRVSGFLVDPNLQTVDIQTTADPAGVLQQSMQFFDHNPIPGVWTLVLAMHDGNPGQKVDEPFTGSVNFRANSVTASQVPHGVVLAAGVPTTATIHVTNSGSTEKQFFVDPRSSAASTMQLLGLDSTTVSLPAQGAQPEFLVPPDVTSLTFDATGSLPIEMDVDAAAGDPDVESSAGTTAAVTYAAPGVTPGCG